MENLVPVGNRLVRQFLSSITGSTSLRLRSGHALGRPKEIARKVALPDLVGAGAGPALSLCKGYAAPIENSAEFLTPAAAPTTLRDSPRLRSVQAHPVNQHSEAGCVVRMTTLSSRHLLTRTRRFVQ